MGPGRLACRIAPVALTLAVTAGSAAAQNGRVVGLVRDEGGEPIKGATVIAQNPDLTPNSFTSATDDKGRFAMIGLRSGEWTFTAQAPGYTGQAGTLRIRQGASTNPPATFTLHKIPTALSALGNVAAKDLQTELAAADQLYNNQKWEEAIAAYRSILAAAPALSVISLQIAAAYRSKGEFDGAIAAYNDLLKTDPNSDKAKVGIAMTNLEKGDLQAAEHTLEVAAQGPGATREVLYNLAEVKLSKNKVEEATKAYERATEVDPTWGRPIFALGRVAMNRGDTDAARKYFEKVLEVDPMSPEAARAKTAIEQLKK